MASANASATTSKKSFFRKPTWATTAPPTEPGDFFRHSDTFYDSILREKERRRQKHAQKKLAKAGTETVEEKGRENKRRRISSDGEDLNEQRQSDSDTASTGSEKEDIAKTEAKTDASGRNGSKSPVSTRRSPRTDASPSKANSSTEIGASTRSQVIELDSGDEKRQSPPKVPEVKVPNQLPDEELSEEEDEYVLQLKQKARERARLKKLGIDPGNNQRQASRTLETQQRQPSFSEDHSKSQQSHAAPTTGPHKDETIVQILIKTEIPNAKPLLVNRKVSQAMQQVREVWCARQNFSDEMKARVIFTWRGKRLYDTSTSVHLLNVLKKERAARQMEGFADEDDEEGPSHGRIEVEAMTKEMYEQASLRKDQEETGLEANNITNESIQKRHSVERSTTPKEPEYKVVMNAQGLEALQLKVRPSTQISRMMAAFKKVRQIDPGKTCWLVFDGDRLEPDSIVGVTEIEDGDAIEVHVR